MRKKYYRKKKRGPVVSKKVEYDGITFASGLEKYMYIVLKEAGIRAKYEGETFVLLNGFHFENEDDLKNYLKKNITSKDVILIKGSRGMRMERFINV